MHGIVFLEFAKFARELMGSQGWRELQEEAAAPNLYRVSETYDDAHLEVLVRGACARSGQTRQGLLEQFGNFIVAPLLDVYAGLIPGHWQLFDLLENTELVIHRVVRLRNASADPPRLRITRTGTTEVTIFYDSPRVMCSFGKGIVTGLSRHYRQPVAIHETSCMDRGDPRCEIRITADETS